MERESCRAKSLAIIIMGVSGSGKTTIGQRFIDNQGIGGELFEFYDGDEFHSAANKEKMSSGVPLNDGDRMSWLLDLSMLIDKSLLENQSIVLACSALKEKYRDVLRGTKFQPFIKFVFLNGEYSLISARLNSRKAHYFHPDLLRSQFDALQCPFDALSLNISLPPEEIVQTIADHFLKKSAIGVYGMGVMGRNLSRNLGRKGISLSLFNRRLAGVEENVAENVKLNYPDDLPNAQPFEDVELFVRSLQTPRKILILVEAGNVTDIVIGSLLSHLSPGDVIVDMGNSHFQDTQRRAADLIASGIYLVGCGISGGEEGALNGPSMMPSGDLLACKSVQVYLNAIASIGTGERPCCSYIGYHGSGHFVKMVHNGIEYAEMQLLAEVYQLSSAAGNTMEEIANMLDSWRADKEVDGYLLEITAAILKTKDEDGTWLLHKILDNAKSKGTGNWATVELTKAYIPATLIAASLFARFMSSFKSLRVSMASQYGGGGINSSSDTNQTAKILSLDLSQLHDAYALARLINHCQGFWLIHEASVNNNWGINLSELARIWTNGCIIRSSLMEDFINIVQESQQVFLHPLVISRTKQYRSRLRSIVGSAIAVDISIPCLNETLNFLNSMTTVSSASNLIQAQRDYFGAHTFQRIDRPPEEFFHHQWI